MQEIEGGIEDVPDSTDRRLKIALLTHFYPPEQNGGATRIQELSRWWARAGHDVTVLTGYPCHPYGVVPAEYSGRFRPVVEIEDGVRVIRGWRYTSPNKGVWRRAAYFASSALTAGALGLFSGGGRPDCIIATSPPLFFGPIGSLVARLRRIPFIFEVRDLWPDQALDLGLLREGVIASVLRGMEHRSYTRASGVITVTNGARDILVRRGYSEDHVRVVRNGVDTTYWRQTNGALSSEAEALLSKVPDREGKTVVGYIGTFGYSQGVDTLIDVARTMRDRSDIHLLFVGAGARWHDVQGALSSCPNVTVYGAVSREAVRDIYSNLDIALTPLRDVPGFRYTVPSKLYEIAALGVPQVVSVPGEASELTISGNLGLSVPPEDVPAIVGAISRLAADHDLRCRISQSARRWAEDTVDRAALASEYIQIIREWIED